MRILIFTTALTILLNAFPLSAQLRWTWQNPRPSADELRAVHALGTDTIVVVGRTGAVFRTTDAGASWEGQNGGTAIVLNGVYFCRLRSGGRVARRQFIVVR